ncbi:hypothetical protein [Geodermatophilus obscurus]|uniref:Uncharacterized protein n=1 Tax=Geodermatophilus obscurus (strain ATCC 25078 / DSM 43160 / JCM 3152 / CCUG 61914 / KCC A-0152 / KCTC 9177 / NBRC 13315 / NRRL B-3577 / G-20) TaxID=526225 RepID=D2S7S0_GEOOG|nr:hypothetical protein [Geodermatophilus obscurus]ADB75529.1 hypothetical protein Gobs_2909 [Geodermatophilus obscurus DSM 43160]
MAAADADDYRRQLDETFHLTGHERVDTVDEGAVLDLGRRIVTVKTLTTETSWTAPYRPVPAMT